MLTLNRRAFYAALKEVARLAHPKASVLALSHANLHAANGVLTATSSDLDTYLSVRIPAQGTIHTCLPAKVLAELVKPQGRSSHDTVAIEHLGDNRYKVIVGDSESILFGLDPADFPCSPGASESDKFKPVLRVPSQELKDALTFVLPAASTDPVRSHLCGVYLTGNQVVATDGHRLHLAKLSAETKQPVLIPGDAAILIAHALPSDQAVVLSASDGFFRLECGSLSFEGKLMNTQFPAFEQVIPELVTAKAKVTVDAGALLKAVTHISKLSEANGLKVRVNGRLTMFVDNPDTGTVEVGVPTVAIEHEGDDFVAGFDKRYLAQLAKSAKAILSLAFVSPLDPLRADVGQDRLAVVMPIRL